MSQMLDTYFEHQVECATNALDAARAEPTRERQTEAAWRLHRLVRMAEQGATFYLPPPVAAAARAFMQ